MDAGGNIIPIVEDDMGEGFMDPIDELEIPQNYNQLPKGYDYKALVEEKLSQSQSKVETKPQPQQQKMLMQTGMSIHFYGFEYKVIKLMKRGRLTLKLIGETTR